MVLPGLRLGLRRLAVVFILGTLNSICHASRQQARPLEISTQSRRILQSSPLYAAPPICGKTCPGTTLPNPSIYAASQACTCSPPLDVTLSLTVVANQGAAFEQSTVSAIQVSIADTLSLSKQQVWLLSANGDAASALTLQVAIFRADDLLWDLVDATTVVNRLAASPSAAGADYTSALMDATLGSAASTSPATSIYYPPGAPLTLTAPPSPTPSSSSSSSSSGLQWWDILLIVLCSVLLLALITVLYFLALVLRNRSSLRADVDGVMSQPIATADEKEDAPLADRKAGPALSSTPSKAKSDFNIKVQEHFVKSLLLEDVIQATDNFAEANELGVGGYGTVYKGIGPGGVQWAVKRAKNANEEGIEDFQNEVDVISKMSHRNLVRLLGYCDEKDEQILVYEFVSNGTLRQHIRPEDRSKRPLSFEQRLEIAVGAAEGLKYLHSFAEPAIIHRDIKCDNILLDDDMTAKVADFGVFKRSTANTDKTQNTRVVGTPGYVDPEYYQTYKVTTKSDVYSFGVVLLELITGRPPIMQDPSVENESYMVTLSRWATPKIAAGKVDTIVDNRLTGAYSRQALNMMAAVTAMCVRRLGRDRPEMAEVATRLAEIKYFLKPSSGILEPVMNLFPDDDDRDNENLVDIPEEEDGHTEEHIPGTTGGVNPYTSDIAAPVSMAFSDR